MAALLWLYSEGGKDARRKIGLRSEVRWFCKVLCFKDFIAMQLGLFWNKFQGLWSLVSLGFYKDCTLGGSSIQYRTDHQLLGTSLAVWQ